MHIPGKLAPLFGVALLLASSTARAQQASGTLAVNGLATPLTHVYAFC